MAELCICLYGDAPTFRAKDGPITARIEVEGGTDSFCFDPERSRCRLETIPLPDPYKWLDPHGLLVYARNGRYGLRVLEDRLPRPADPPGRRHGRGRGGVGLTCRGTSGAASSAAGPWSWCATAGARASAW